jgi:hypothetical protein
MRTLQESDRLWFGTENEGGGLVDASVGGSKIRITTVSKGSEKTDIIEENYSGEARKEALWDTEGKPMKSKVTFDQSSVTPGKLGTEVGRTTDSTSDSPESLLPPTQAGVPPANPATPPTPPSTRPYIWKYQ